MKKSSLIYGLAAGAFLTLGLAVGFLFGEGSGSGGYGSELFGYSFMLIALSVIFVGVKRYRDRELGGVIRFSTAFLLGLGITLVASVIYVASWEVVLQLTDFAFAEDYYEATVAAKRDAGLSGTELEAAITEAEKLKRQYYNPAFRLPVTFIEIFPVGLLVTLIAAAVLRKSEVLPAA